MVIVALFVGLFIGAFAGVLLMGAITAGRIDDIKNHRDN